MLSNEYNDSVLKRYRKLAIQYHPDKNPSDKEKAEENFKVVGEAYNVLSNKDTRSICAFICVAKSLTKTFTLQMTSMEKKDSTMGLNR